MNAFRKHWLKADAGSIDLIQVVVGLMIISAAAVGTLKGLYYGYEQLDYQMRYKKALSIARAHVEYLQGRIHTDMKMNKDLSPADQQFLAGTLPSPKSWMLDKRDPNVDFDDISCNVSNGPIEIVDLKTTGPGVDHYRFQVYVTWFEPGDQSVMPPHEISFAAYMVQAAQ